MSLLHFKIASGIQEESDKKWRYSAELEPSKLTFCITGLSGSKTLNGGENNSSNKLKTDFYNYLWVGSKDDRSILIIFQAAKRVGINI